MSQVSGYIGFEHLRVNCIIGILPHERTQKQEIFIDLKVKAKFGFTSKTEDLNETIDYVELTNLSRDLAQSGKYYLIETLAKEILDSILKRFDVEEAWVKIKKPGALPDAKCAFVELEKSGGE